MWQCSSYPYTLNNNSSYNNNKNKNNITTSRTSSTTTVTTTTTKITEIKKQSITNNVKIKSFSITNYGKKQKVTTETVKQQQQQQLLIGTITPKSTEMDASFKMFIK